MNGNVNQHRIYVDTDYMPDNNDQYQYHYNNISIEGAMKIINAVYKNSLTEQSPRIKASKNFITPTLFQHQEAALHAMILKEKELMTGPYYNQVGILDTGPASGKTLTVLAHIAHCKELSGADTVNAKIVQRNNNHFSYNIHDIQYRASCPTLIIVAHNNFRGWENAIKTHTFFNPLYIEKPSHISKLIRNETFIEKINESDFVLLSDKYWKKFSQELLDDHIQFKRIYIDSPEIINIKNTNKMFPPGFIWLITNTWYNFIPRILYYTQAYLRNAKGDIDQEFKSELDKSLNSTFFNSNIRSYKFCDEFMSYNSENYRQVLRCRRDFVKESMKLMPIAETLTICKITRSQRALIPALTDKISSYIRQKDISNAYYELGIETLTLPTLMQQIKDELIVQREKCINDQNVVGILAVDEKLKNIEERLITNASTECPVCFEIMQNSVYLPCCKQCVCGECALNLITPVCRMKCIYCRKYNAMSDIKLIGDADTPKETALSKFEEIYEYIQALPPNSKVIIFAMKDYHFYELLDCFQNKKTPSLFIKNVYAGSELARDVFSFQYRTNIKLLCLTETCIQESINLDSATHIITFYKLPFHIKELLISRANSLERSSPLQFASFLYQDGIQDLSTLLAHNEDQY